MSESMEEIVLKVPETLLNEVDSYTIEEECDRNDFLCQAIRMYLREKKERQIRESMCQGYMEMAKINLTIASEAFQAEEEAEHTLEQLVSGV
ncbi:CopG family transcriptional regulator / antitoxin EndoAI [Salimicrobium salexigens]|uniref:CopG family transcriptional regulator / antitoxin EndoAI n=2 Tax=Salimicrobium salexigens TaxID=908941 RepID=A0ABY1KW14_9BACI|nr:antitoxin [Salimicrobium salexigens]SIS84426.1 CopG family transcriptional regulator / antitoxin EndoAI [Salimicrobium salexigens]